MNLTDKEIKKALGCCKSFNDLRACYKCPALKNGDCSNGKVYISNFILDNALDLINRLQDEKQALINGQETLQNTIVEQKAEIEMLRRHIKEYGFCNLLGNCLVYSKTLKDYNDMRKGLKVGAKKEFAERLCKDRVSNDPVVIAVKTELKLTERKE